MPGPNYGLDKGFKVQTTSPPVREFEAAFLVDPVTVRRANAANEKCLGIFQYDMNDADVATGKSHVGVRMTGITRGIAGAAIPFKARVGTNAVGRLVSVEGAVAGTPVLGEALSPASAAGDQFDLWLTPGAKI